MKKLQANVDDTRSKTVVFNPSIMAQYIRLHPTNCSNECALRFELYGCNVTTGNYFFFHKFWACKIMYQKVLKPAW